MTSLYSNRPQSANATIDVFKKRQEALSSVTSEALEEAAVSLALLLGFCIGLTALILQKASSSSRRGLSIIMVLTVFLLLPLSAGTTSAAYPGHFSHQSLHPRDVGPPEWWH